MSKHKTKGTRISKENYCRRCDYRSKREGKTVCLFPMSRFGLEPEPIVRAMSECELLMPFERYKMENTEQ